MPGPSRKAAAWLPILVILVAMTSIQSGASLAKSLFPVVGAPGVTALRLALGTLILVVVFKPWRLRFSPAQRVPLLLYGPALGAMNYLFIYPCSAFRSAWRWPRVYRPAGGGAVCPRRPLDFVWVTLAILGLWYLLPLGQNVAQVDLTGALFALGAGACWAVYILTGQRAGEEHGPATVAMGSLIASLVFVPLGMAQATDTLWQWSLLPLGLGIAILSTALPYSLEMMALTRLPTRTFGTLMSLEPALAALSGMIFLGETLKLSQTPALGAIIIASMGATLTMQRQSKVEQVDIN